MSVSHYESEEVIVCVAHCELCTFSGTFCFWLVRVCTGCLNLSAATDASEIYGVMSKEEASEVFTICVEFQA